TPLLSGGNDWLAYETFARDIAFNGPLMTAGKPLGQGEAFYYQPLYAYLLTPLHLLLGESVYGVLVAQYTLVALAGVLCYLLGRAQLRKFGQRRAALGAAGLLLLVSLAVFSLAPLRNYLVAGRLVLLPESASTNIYETHRPSARVDLSRIDRDPLYNRLGLD